MPTMQPITIRRGSFVCNIYDIGNLMRLPLANVRKLWRIMFSAEDENRETIEMIRGWLPVNVENTKRTALDRQELFQVAAKEAEHLRREVAAFGSVATKEQRAALATARRGLKAFESTAKAAAADHVKAQKLQTIFNDFTTK